MPLLRFPRATFLLRPCVAGSVVWIMVWLLYSLHLSSLLLFDKAEATRTILYITAPIIAVSLGYEILLRAGKERVFTKTLVKSPSLPLIEARLRQCMRLWIGMAIVETIVSGGVPLLWLLTGSAKANFDYGISSVHGMVNALMLAIAVTSYALYLYTGERRHVWLPLFALMWAVVLVSRGTIFVLVMECAVVYLRLRTVKPASLLKLGALACLLLLAFGYIGDVRSGAEAFKTLAQPTPEFPEWAPSGLLWAYIYITTPLNNLLYSMHTIQPSFNLLLPNTAATLFPTVLRNLIYGKAAADSAISGGLVVEALNVSTAYVGPFQDMGRIGIVGFSAIAASLCEVYWHRSGFRNILYFSVFTQALILSLFYNLLFSLPILGQLIWFYYFTRLREHTRR